MTDSGIPQPVRDFINRHIGSVEHLEVLLLMRRRSGESMTAAAVSAELRTSILSANEKLTDLHADKLLDIQASSPPAYRYRFQPGTAQDTLIADLDKAYSERRFTVIDLIFSKPLKHVQVFADAFLWSDKAKDAQKDTDHG